MKELSCSYLASVLTFLSYKSLESLVSCLPFVSYVSSIQTKLIRNQRNRNIKPSKYNINFDERSQEVNTLTLIIQLFNHIWYELVLNTFINLGFKRSCVNQLRLEAIEASKFLTFHILN
jgi:hypothetical protein